MTIFFPDVSHFQAGLSLNGAVACIAKASEGNYWTDLSFTDFKAQAIALGIPFLPYHFLNTGDVAGNVAWCKKLAGDVPVMLDVETARNGGKPSLAETLEFCDRHGKVVLAYIPHWYWQGWGSPDLTGLTKRGVGLISSYYTTYSDTGPGWAPYGGVSPVIWQYTDAHQFNGELVDFNAFKGMQEQLRALFNGGGDMSADDVVVGQSQLYDQAANRSTPTGRNFANDAYKVQRMADGFADADPNLKARLDGIDKALADLATAVAAISSDHRHTVAVTGGGSTGPAEPVTTP